MRNRKRIIFLLFAHRRTMRGCRFGTSFEGGQVGEDLGEGLEAALEDVGFAGADGGIFYVKQVDDAQVDAADFGLVVVYQADAFGRVGREDFDFFGQFAAHAFFVGRGVEAGIGVDGGDVPADAHAALAVQSAFAHARAAGVLEDVQVFFRVGIRKDHVGDQLFEAGVLLDFAAGTVAGMLAG